MSVEKASWPIADVELSRTRLAQSERSEAIPCLARVWGLADSITAARNADLPIAVTSLVILTVACTVDHQGCNKSARLSASPHVLNMALLLAVQCNNSLCSALLNVTQLTEAARKPMTI